MKKILFALSACAILLILPNQAKADVVYNNFGPGDSYQTNIGWTIGYQAQIAPDYQQYMQPAAAFTPTANYDLTSIEAALSYYAGPNNSVELLLTNSINNQPGTTLETFSFSGLGPLGANNAPLLANSVLHPELIAGDQYWLEAINPDPNNSSTAAWNFSNKDALMIDSSDNGQTWFNLNSYYPNQGAFLINGDPATSAVPEPPTVLLFAFAGALVLFFNRRKMLRAAA